MKYLRKFAEHSEYDEYASSGIYEKPNVSKCIAEDDVHYNKIVITVTNSGRHEYWFYDLDDEVILKLAAGATGQLNVPSNGEFAYDITSEIYKIDGVEPSTDWLYQHIYYNSEINKRCLKDMQNVTTMEICDGAS